MKKKYYWIWGLIVLLVIISIVLLIRELGMTTNSVIQLIRKPSINTNSNFQFLSGPCDMSPYDKTNLGIKETKWLDDSTIQVKAYVSIDCGEEIMSGDFEVSNNKIILKYKSPLCNICSCMCAHELTYKIKYLSKKDYQFELERLD